MEDKKIHINDLPVGDYPLQIKSIQLEVEEGGARWLKFTFESVDKNISGDIKHVVPAYMMFK